MKWFNALLPDLTAKLRRMIRREIHRDIQNSLVTHATARQSFDLYEMRLETLDTRIAKRILALEDRVAELEAAGVQAADQPVRKGASMPTRQTG
ncbi:MAG: hypothetical protein AB8B85_06085 [Paracoccaceae bacterium]